jgi:hypothetical protein
MPRRAIVIVDPGREPYLVQMALARAALVVFGMHGGGLWGAARWMREGQTMVEVLSLQVKLQAGVDSIFFQYMALVIHAQHV